jgi:serine/threonine-protein kinase HSL1 (negative regulator of Swe1 kinase)
MLDTDVTRRITMPDILRHPFFLSRPLKNPDALAPNRDVGLIAQRRLTPRSTIDPDIFANLRTLWHGTSDSDLVEALTSPDHNWQKGIYHLLSDYRKKYLDSRREEEEVIQARKRRKQQRQAAKQYNVTQILSPVFPFVLDLPHLVELADRNIPMSWFNNDFRSRSKAWSERSFDLLVGPFTRREIYGGRLDEDLSMVAAPDLEDEKIRAFFQQVANHLNVLQARTTSTILQNLIMNRPLYSSFLRCRQQIYFWLTKCQYC